MRKFFSRHGWIMLIMTIVVLMSAINTGRNLLYLMFTLMLAAIFLSLLLPRVQLFGVIVTRRGPLYATQQQPVSFSVDVWNRKPWPAFLLKITEPSRARVLLPIVKVNAGQRLQLHYSHSFERRGRYRLPPLELSCGFPFGFYDRRASTATDSSIIIYPSYKKIQTLPPVLLDNPHDDQRRLQRKPGEGLNFLFIREYRPEDGWRKIHWRSTARLGKLMVKEYERGGLFRYLLALQPDPGPQGEEAFELGIRAAAAMSDFLLKRSYLTALVSGARPSSASQPFRNDRSYFMEVIEALALMTIKPGATLVRTLQPWLYLIERGVLLTVFMFRFDPEEFKILEAISRQGGRLCVIWANPTATADAAVLPVVANALSASIWNEQQLERLQFGGRS